MSLGPVPRIVSLVQSILPWRLDSHCHFSGSDHSRYLHQTLSLYSAAMETEGKCDIYSFIYLRANSSGSSIQKLDFESKEMNSMEPGATISPISSLSSTHTSLTEDMPPEGSDSINALPEIILNGVSSSPNAGKYLPAVTLIRCSQESKSRQRWYSFSLLRRRRFTRTRSHRLSIWKIGEFKLGRRRRAKLVFYCCCEWFEWEYVIFSSCHRG